MCLYVFYEQHTNKHTHNLSQAELVAYKAIHHHTNVPCPCSDKKYKKLGRWVSWQRDLKKKNNLDEERMKKLDDIGFVWDKHEADWQMNFVSHCVLIRVL